MFKLLPLLLVCIVCSIASPGPDARYNLITSNSGSISGSIRSTFIKPYQSFGLTAKSQQRSKLLQTNSFTSGEDENNSSSNIIKNNNDDIDDEESLAPTSATSASASVVTSTDYPAPTVGSIASAPASLKRLKAIASTSGSASASDQTLADSSLRVSSLLKLPAGSSSSTSIQHHILPAETIPLPITISTRPGLRTIIAPETITVHEPILAKVGEVIQKIPTAVSHQSQTVVHKHARVVTPIVAPAVRTFTSQILRAYHTPLIFAPQTTVVRSSSGTGQGTVTVTGTAAATGGYSASAKVLAKTGTGTDTSASASASISSNAKNNGDNNKKRYKY